MRHPPKIIRKIKEKFLSCSLINVTVFHSQVCQKVAIPLTDAGQNIEKGIQRELLISHWVSCIIAQGAKQSNEMLLRRSLPKFKPDSFFGNRKPLPLVKEPCFQLIYFFGMCMYVSTCTNSESPSPSLSIY